MVPTLHAAVHGQTIWIDPTADMVIVRFASSPVAANAASDPTSLPAYRAVADHLMAIDDTPLLGREWVIEDIAGGAVGIRIHPLFSNQLEPARTAELRDRILAAGLPI
jgi:CubicO group peptidase (beta-lactamase class C family)